MTFSTFIFKLRGRIGFTIFSIYDYFCDISTCGCSLVGYVPTAWRQTKGSTASGPSHYFSLQKVFEGSEFKDSDRFIDVGCAKGRVLAYAKRAGFKGHFTGVEHNPVVAEYGKKWANKLPNFEIINGDAFDLDYNNYNIIFLARPFEPWAFNKFIPMLEKQLKHPVTFYYWVDQQSGQLLKDRKGWTCLRRGKVYKKFGLHLEYSPQGFSVWTFDPQV